MRLFPSIVAALLLVWPLHAQSGSVDVLATAGHAQFCIAGNSFCGKPHVFAGVSPRLYLTRRWGFQPEFSYSRMLGVGNDDHFAFIGNFTVDFGDHERVKPYLIFGGGWLHQREFGRILNTLTLDVGYGVRGYVSKSVFVAPELRWGPGSFLRVGASVGYTFGRR